ncbi:MAG TPA: T9SS type A sorting domain-containing protein [Bacteroidetes bacterium]|nr:T9SS type A sorting domain-containing protein [Bacteroidota bacterium]
MDSITITGNNELERNEDNSQMRIYPNPTKDKIYIQNTNDKLTDYTIEIYNAISQCVFSEKVQTRKKGISLKKLGSNGIYVLYLKDTENKTLAIKQLILQ